MDKSFFFDMVLLQKHILKRVINSVVTLHFAPFCTCWQVVTAFVASGNVFPAQDRVYFGEENLIFRDSPKATKITLLSIIWPFEFSTDARKQACWICSLLCCRIFTFHCWCSILWRILIEYYLPSFLKAKGDEPSLYFNALIKICHKIQSNTSTKLEFQSLK